MRAASQTRPRRQLIPNERVSRAAESTVEALAYQLHAGTDALREASAQRRLAELDEAQMRGIAGRLTRARWGKSDTPQRVPPWAESEIETFIETWRALHATD